MWTKLRTTGELFFGHFGLWLGIVLLVWLPANLLIEISKLSNDTASPLSDRYLEWQLRLLFSMIVGAVGVGALVYALLKLLHDEPVSCMEAVFMGVCHWWPMFLARIVSQVAIVLGLVLLIVPGVYWTVRWALTPFVLVAEDPGVLTALRGSWRLTRGMVVELLAGTVLLIMCWLGFNLLVGLCALSLSLVRFLFGAPEYVDLLFNLGVGCMLALTFIPVYLLLGQYYIEARPPHD